MPGLYKRKRDVALITIVYNKIDLVDNKSNEKIVAKRSRDRKWIKHRGEKGTYNNIVLDLFLHDLEGFHFFLCMNYEQFIELTEMIALIFPKQISDEENDTQTKTGINLKISCS